ncbi:hypothetical protein [Stenotrophomonas muris]|uniref:hypothetical protein n=1 Tax=Stenotrophomonas muris TaxID=2963283 RepID=UPI0039C655BD
MTNPLGRYWPQPDGLRDRVRVFETHATIDEADWERLPRYDGSFPSGTYPGKAWRRGKFLCWYGRERDDRISVGCARALVQTNGTNVTPPRNAGGKS